jgi:acetylornithine/N-succinyldiaminopimelate aminotransferase
MGNRETIETEDKYFPPFFDKTQVSIERGQGVYVWDENDKKYIDFTSGWGVTCIGHANPIITDALARQSKKIIQNPNSGATYSPSRAELLSLMKQILPPNLNRIFFTNSGAESNDAAIKLARKASGKRNIISTSNSFHGRTISTVSATGQSVHREKFRPLMPHNVIIPYNDIDALTEVIDDEAAAVILEPIQGEGGIIIPSDSYLESVSTLCREKDVYLIVDEIQTGFCRTGTMFAIDPMNVKADFLTMAKGIAGGFPFGAFAMSEEVAQRLEKGDHGGTYCGNPLGCAVAHAVITFLIDNGIEKHVEALGTHTMERLKGWKDGYPDSIVGIRGKGLLIAVEFSSNDIVDEIRRECLRNGLILNVTHGTVIRIFPALNITVGEMDEGLAILKNAVDKGI